MLERVERGNERRWRLRKGRTVVGVERGKDRRRERCTEGRGE
jgi:hypothetical protein